MSITLINPSGEISVQDDLWHIATSTNYQQTDFKYVFDVFVNGEQLVRTKIYPEPSNGNGYFDASQVVRNEIKLNWFPPLIGPNLRIYQPSLSGEIAVNYDIQVGEEFSGITTLNMASATIRAYNYVPQLFKRRKIKISDYDNSFMTNRDKKNIRNGTLTNRIYIPFNSAIENPFPVITGYYPNNNVAFVRQYSLHQAPTGNKFMQFDVGGKNVNYFLNAAGPRPLASDIAYYEISFVNTITDKIRIYLDCNSKFTPIPLHFINGFGMYETAIFDLVSKLSLTTERKTFTKREYTFGQTSVNYYDGNNVYAESKINYGSKTNWEYKLTMNFPSDKDWAWLQELILSPLIYAEIDDNFYPVTIKETNYEVNQHVWGGLKALELNIELNQTRFGYRR